MKKITYDLLKKLGACQEGLEFWKNNNLDELLF